MPPPFFNEKGAGHIIRGMKPTWEEVIEGLQPLAFREAFDPTPEEEALYRLLLLGAAEMDDTLFGEALDKGGKELLTRYSPEEATFGIVSFQEDLSQARKAYFAERGQDAFYAHIIRFAAWASAYGLDDITRWVADSPHYQEYVDKLKAYWWVSTYRSTLGLIPPEMREALEPVARFIADFRALQEEIWAKPGLSRADKEIAIANAYAEYQKRIGETLLQKGYPPTLASPAGLSPQLVRQAASRLGVGSKP